MEADRTRRSVATVINVQKLFLDIILSASASLVSRILPQFLAVITFLNLSTWFFFVVVFRACERYNSRLTSDDCFILVGKTDVGGLLNSADHNLRFC